MFSSYEHEKNSWLNKSWVHYGKLCRPWSWLSEGVSEAMWMASSSIKTLCHRKTNLALLFIFIIISYIIYYIYLLHYLHIDIKYNDFIIKLNLFHPKLIHQRGKRNVKCMHSWFSYLLLTKTITRKRQYILQNWNNSHKKTLNYSL